MSSPRAPAFVFCFFSLSVGVVASQLWWQEHSGRCCGQVLHRSPAHPMVGMDTAAPDLPGWFRRQTAAQPNQPGEPFSNLPDWDWHWAQAKILLVSVISFLSMKTAQPVISNNCMVFFGGGGVKSCLSSSCCFFIFTFSFVSRCLLHPSIIHIFSLWLIPRICGSTSGWCVSISVHARLSNQDKLTAFTPKWPLSCFLFTKLSIQILSLSPFTAIYWLSPIPAELVFKLFVQEMIIKLISCASGLREQSW